MIKHILVAYDGSSKSEEAYDLALDFADKFKAALTVLSVAQLPEPAEDEEAEAIIESAKKKYKEMFNALKLRAKKHPTIKLNFEIKAGHPAEQIIYYAEKNHVDHIVVGHRGNTFFERLLLGSVAKQVMIYAHCAITIVR